MPFGVPGATEASQVKGAVASGSTALPSTGIETQLVIYPNQNHGITTPSYARDRLDRYVKWYDKFLKAAAPVPTASK